MTGVMRVWMAASVLAISCGAAVAAAQDLPALPDGQRQGQRMQNPPAPPNSPQGGKQALRPQPGRGLQGDPISPADVQAMFEAMMVMEAERFVMLTPEQFPVFVQRLKRLQEARGMLFRRHNRALAELRGMANPQTGRADDATIEGKLKELETIEIESRAAIGKALESIDQLLSPRQRARFRLLEDNVEKKKIDFLTRVRQQGGRSGQ